MRLLYGLLVGIAMGMLLSRVGASSPRMILSNLRLQNLTIIKFMALTIAVGTLAVYGLAQSLGLPLHLDIKPTYLLGVLAGGLVFGVGFAVAGYCPGTCVVGIGEGRKDAWFAFGGGVVGALLFTIVYRWLAPVFVERFNYGKITLADVAHIPTTVAAVGLAMVIFVVLKLLPDRRGPVLTR